ncbi:MAG: glutathione S-transferase [Hyphomicrobiaceae bacterium]|jgi:glutathione S-transferase
MLKLVGAGLSPWVRRVMIVMDEKGIEYEHEAFFPFGEASKEFKQKSPLALVPYLETEDGPLADSTAICAYLDARYPTPALFPTDPYARGRSVWFSEFADAVFKLEGTIFFQKVVRGHMMKEEPDHAAIETAREALTPLFAYLDGELEGRSYLTGDIAYLCDITLASVLLNYLHAGETIDSSTSPNLRGFLDRMFERPSFASQIDDDLTAVGELSTVKR